MLHCVCNCTMTPLPSQKNSDNEIGKNSHFMLGKYGIYFYHQCVYRMEEWKV